MFSPAQLQINPLEPATCRYPRKQMFRNCLEISRKNDFVEVCLWNERNLRAYFETIMALLQSFYYKRRFFVTLLLKYV